jgi:transposase
MLSLPPSTRIFLCSKPADMRQSFDALSGLVQTHFGQNPLCGHLFVFFSKRRDRMKVLFWDIDGFVLYYKRLEKGTFSWVSNIGSDSGVEILACEFALVLAGINPCDIKQQKHYRRLPETSIA